MGDPKVFTCGIELNYWVLGLSVGGHHLDTREGRVMRWIVSIGPLHASFTPGLIFQRGNEPHKEQE